MDPLTFQITSMTRDGIIAVLINDKKYTYSIDAAHYPKILQLSRFKKGKALDFIKKHSKLIEKEKTL